MTFKIKKMGRIRGAFEALKRGAGYVAGEFKRWTRNWRTSSGSPDGEIIGDLKTMRERSRDLYKNDNVGGGLIDLIVGHTIGSGLKMHTAIDRETITKHLNLGEKESIEFFDNLENQIETSFNEWAESLESDFHGEANFYENQSLAFLSVLQSGEVFLTMPMKQHFNAPQRLRIGLIEADQVQSPLGIANSRTNRDGVETLPDGTPVAYWVNRNQEEWQPDFQRLPKFGALSGRQMIYHLFQRKRPGQTRGVPLLTRMMRDIRKLQKYKNNELDASEVAALFTAFITSESGQKVPQGLVNSDGGQTDDEIADEGQDLQMGSGAIVALLPGEGIELANPTRPNSNYAPFIEAQLKQIGMGVGVPFEILVRIFQSSFSASRASRIEMQKLINAYRRWFNLRMNQPTYQEWLMDEVLSGRIIAPGFFDNHEIHKAYLKSIWIGDSMGMIDPQKEVDAAFQTVKKQFSTMTEQTAMLTGNKYSDVVKVLAREKRMREKQGVPSELDESIVEPMTIDNQIIEKVDNAIDNNLDEKVSEKLMGLKK